MGSFCVEMNRFVLPFPKRFTLNPPFCPSPPPGCAPCVREEAVPNQGEDEDMEILEEQLHAEQEQYDRPDCTMPGWAKGTQQSKSRRLKLSGNESACCAYTSFAVRTLIACFDLAWTGGSSPCASQ